MKFIRTVSTAVCWPRIVGLLIAIAAGTAIAVAAAGPGPVPAPSSLAGAVHKALAAPAVTGISADISFTNKLIDASDFTSGSTDPILQGATGRLWLSNDHQLRLELQSDNGDSQVVVNNTRSGSPIRCRTRSTRARCRPTRARPTRATSPAPPPARSPRWPRSRSRSTSSASTSTCPAPPPTDVAGRPAYTVSVSPKHDGGLLGQAQLAWDAVKGVPLRFAIYAKNDSSPVIELKATNISYGPVSCVGVRHPAPGRLQGGQDLERQDGHGDERLPRRQGQGGARQAAPPPPRSAAWPRSPAACRSRRRRPARWSACRAAASSCSTWAASRPRWSPTARTSAASR